MTKPENIIFSIGIHVALILFLAGCQSVDSTSIDDPPGELPDFGSRSFQSMARVVLRLTNGQEDSFVCFMRYDIVSRKLNVVASSDLGVKLFHLQCHQNGSFNLLTNNTGWSRQVFTDEVVESIYASLAFLNDPDPRSFESEKLKVDFHGFVAVTELTPHPRSITVVNSKNRSRIDLKIVSFKFLK